MKQRRLAVSEGMPERIDDRPPIHAVMDDLVEVLDQADLDRGSKVMVLEWVKMRLFHRWEHEDDEDDGEAWKEGVQA